MCGHCPFLPANVLCSRLSRFFGTEMRSPRPKLFSHQNDLPRLPVMDLQETCKRYLFR